MFVAVPTLVAAIYFGLVAADRYVAQARLVVNAENEATGAALSGLIGGLTGGGQASSQGQLLVTFVQSHALLAELEKQTDVAAIYRHSDADWLSRLAESAKFEDRYEYLSEMVSIEWDGHSRVVNISVQAFSPDDAKRLLDTIVQISERQLNAISLRQQADSMRFAREELARAEGRLSKARMALAQFRRDNQEIDPAGTAAQVSTLMASISSRITMARAELAEKSAYLRSDSPQVQGLVAEIRQLEALRQNERTGLVGPQRDALAEKVSRYEELLIEEEFAREAYKAAMIFFERAQSEAMRQQSYVIDFAPAVRPEIATEPRRLEQVLVVLLGSLIALALGNLIFASIREQAKL